MNYIKIGFKKNSNNKKKEIKQTVVDQPELIMKIQSANIWIRNS